MVQNTFIVMLMGMSCCKGFLHCPCSEPKQQGICCLLRFARWVCQGLQESSVLALTACVIMAALDQAPHSTVGPIKGPLSSETTWEQSVKDLVNICACSPLAEVWEDGLRNIDHEFISGRLYQHQVVSSCLVGVGIVHPLMVQAPKTSPNGAPSTEALTVLLITVKLVHGVGACVSQGWHASTLLSPSTSHQICNEPGTKLLHWRKLLESFALHLLPQTKSEGKQDQLIEGVPQGNWLRGGMPFLLTATVGGHWPDAGLRRHLGSSLCGITTSWGITKIGYFIWLLLQDNQSPGTYFK